MRPTVPLGQIGRVGLADLMTIANGVCGFAAIVVLLEAPPSSAAWGASLLDGHLGVVLALLMGGMVCDSLDGVVARRRGPSGLGGALDLMCDAVTFGVLPALLLIQSPASEGATGALVAGLVGGVYFAAVLLRLAGFADGHHDEHRFTGLPSPAAAVAAIALLLLAPGTIAALAGMAVIALLMVSSYAWPHPGAAGMAAISAIGCFTMAAAFAGWVPVGLVAVVGGGWALLIGPLQAGGRRVGALVATAGRTPQEARAGAAAAPNVARRV